MTLAAIILLQSSTCFLKVLDVMLSSREICDSVVPCLLVMLLSRNVVVDVHSARLSPNKW